MPWNLIWVNEKIKNKIYDYFVMKKNNTDGNISETIVNVVA